MLTFCSKYLDKRLRELLNSGFELGNKKITEVNIPPFADKCNSSACDCEYTYPSYHFVIILDKKFRTKLNYDKKYIYKLLSNRRFMNDFIKLNHDVNSEIEHFKLPSALSESSLK